MVNIVELGVILFYDFDNTLVNIYICSAGTKATKLSLQDLKMLFGLDNRMAAPSSSQWWRQVNN